MASLTARFYCVTSLLIGMLLPLHSAYAQRAAGASHFPNFEVAVTLPSTSQPVLAPSAKSPGTSALFSLLITGGGQFYNEEPVKGGVMLAAGVLFTVLAFDGVNEYGCDAYEKCAPWELPVGIVGGLTVKLWSIIDATSGARRWNRRHNVSAIDVRPTIGATRLAGGRFGLSMLQAAF